MTAISSASLVLYGAATGNSVRAAIALEEAGIPYTARCVDLRRGEQRSKAFLSLNPAGKVPVLVGHGDDDAALVISQSSSIMLYAARLGRPELFPETVSGASAIAMERFLYRYRCCGTRACELVCRAARIRADGRAAPATQCQRIRTL